MVSRPTCPAAAPPSHRRTAATPPCNSCEARKNTVPSHETWGYTPASPFETWSWSLGSPLRCRTKLPPARKRCPSRPPPPALPDTSGWVPMSLPPALGHVLCERAKNRTKPCFLLVFPLKTSQKRVPYLWIYQVVEGQCPGSNPKGSPTRNSG